MEDIQNKKPIATPNPNNGQVMNSHASSGPKELERPVSDFIKPSEELRKIDIELEYIGVEQTHEQPQLDETHEQIGVIHSPADTPVQTEPSGKVQLPMTKDDAEQIVKENKGQITVDQHGDHTAYTVPSRLGLATLVLKLFKWFR